MPCAPFASRFVSIAAIISFFPTALVIPDILSVSIPGSVIVSATLDPPCQTTTHLFFPSFTLALRFLPSISLVTAQQPTKSYLKLCLVVCGWSDPSPIHTLDSGENGTVATTAKPIFIHHPLRSIPNCIWLLGEVMDCLNRLWLKSQRLQQLQQHPYNSWEKGNGLIWMRQLWASPDIFWAMPTPCPQWLSRWRPYTPFAVD